MKNLPKKIYLQFCEFKDSVYATWCEDRVDDTDIEYILNIENKNNGKTTRRNTERS